MQAVATYLGSRGLEANKDHLCNEVNKAVNQFGVNALDHDQHKKVRQLLAVITNGILLIVTVGFSTLASYAIHRKENTSGFDKAFSFFAHTRSKNRVDRETKDIVETSKNVTFSK